MKLEDIGKRYVYEKVLAPTTITSYTRKAMLFDESIEYSSIENLTQDDVFQWRDKLIQKGVRATSINSYIRHCRVLWQFAFEKGWVENQVVFNIRRLPEIKIKKTISNASLECVKNCFSADDYGCAWFWLTVFTFQSETGIRNAQLVNIKAKDINLNEGTLFCSPQGSKTNTGNELPLTQNIINAMVQYFKHSRKMLGRNLQPDDFLFEIARYDRKFKLYSDGMSVAQLHGSYRKLSKVLMRKTGERISGHRLRHTLATKIGSQSNVNIRVVQEFFGWSSIQTAQNYIQVGLSQKRELISILQE